MLPRPTLTLLLLAILVFSTSGAIQSTEDPFDIRLRHAREAVHAGEHVAAATHLERALVLRPFNEEALGLAFDNARDRADARVLWAHRYWDALTDAKGALAAHDRRVGEAEGATTGLRDLARARAAAVAELVRLNQDYAKRGTKDPAQGLVALWSAELATELSRLSPALLEAHGPTLQRELEISRRQMDAVIKDLKRVHSRAASQGDHSTAVRAARIARGLAAQGDFEELQGYLPPGIAALRRWADEALSKSRARLEIAVGEPLTLEQLEDMTEEEIRAFTLEHSDLSRPGVSRSPKGLYRIETCCGHETLLGVTDTVEDHHARLARWFGEDPFQDRPGLMRIVPEAAGLESEGAGFWWVGGFQGGDTTTLRFSCGTIEGLGHGIVHELTHRFDGALYPGTPAWLAEGKAVWTGGSYGSVYDETFVEDHISFGTVESAWIKGYGGEKKLRELLVGEIEDYRDNYVAGYALYVYLKLWQEPEGSYLYAPKLETYMEGLAHPKGGHEQWFVACFADGKDGRPEDFATFAKAFQTFLAGFYWDDRAPWTSRYVSSVKQAGGPWVYDVPTWTWSRSRAEPYWGQDHAWRAGDLFLERGKEEEAAQAYLWAWTVDERTPRRHAKLAGVLEEIGDRDAAWVLRNAWRRRFAPLPADADEPDPRPMRLARTGALLTALRSEHAALLEAGHERAAAAIGADHNRAAAYLGLEPLELRVPPPVENPLHPWDETARRLGYQGWTESGLTGYERRRAEGCWYVEPDGDLHVGRYKPRDGTGQLDRRAHQRHAFTLTGDEQAPGRYVLRCRIQFTTSYVSGALILGYDRRDRNVRLTFSAGDFYYSIGKKEQSEEIEKVSWRVSGLRDRDGPLTGSVRGGAVGFDSPRTNFELVALVDGAAAHFWIEGEYLGAYHDALGTPITGAIGFATGQGALRVIDPVVQRLDRSQQVGALLSAGTHQASPVESGLDLRQPTSDSFRRLLNRPVRGLLPDPSGTLLVWVPIPDWEESERETLLDACVEKTLKLAGKASSMLYRAGADQPLLFALPDKLDQPRRARLQTELPEILEEIPWRLTSYHWTAPNTESGEALSGEHRTWLGFIDSAGVLRHCDRFYGMARTFPDDLVHWLTVFRDDDGSR
jgi:hypothetical protein